MSYDIKDTIQKLFDDDGLREILLSVEEYLDNMDLYVFENWIDGELVSGPIVSKYLVECTFKYFLDAMPDPRGALLFNNQDTKVEFKRDFEMVPIEIPLSPNDVDASTNKNKAKRKEIILVKFTIPRKLIDSNSVKEYEILDQDDLVDDSLPEYICSGDQDFDTSSVVPDQETNEDKI